MVASHKVGLCLCGNFCHWSLYHWSLYHWSRYRLGRRWGHPFAFDTGGFSGQTPKIVQLGAPDAATHDHFNFVNPWRMEGEYPFHSDPVGNFAHREGLSVTAIGPTNHDALEDLNPFFITFDNFGMDANRIAGFETGKVTATLLFFNTVDHVAHFFFLHSSQQSAKREEETSPQESVAKALGLTDSPFLRFSDSFVG
jgi:hypothetical protein